MNTNALEIKMLTDTQIARKVVAQAKKWCKSKGYNDVYIHCIRGTYHATNAGNYWMTAQYILETSTGLKFIPYGASMAKRVKEDTAE